MKTRIRIGRDHSNDVIINEPRVSRNHAIVMALPDGSFEAKDLGSANGTFVNGEKISCRVINIGDQLMVASSLVRWEEAFEQAPGTLIREIPNSVRRKTMTVGSGAGNDLVLGDPLVSEFHAKISLLRNGDYFIEDLGSTNGSFVNGTKVSAKNFSRTDLVKIAGQDLPHNWFASKAIRPHFWKDHSKKLVSACFILLVIASSWTVYINRCAWLGGGCTLTAGELYTANKNTLVHIQHSYYYTMVVKGRKYYVGKNKTFPEYTEANTSTSNILPYDSIGGNGCFVTKDGMILTSQVISAPWLNKEEQEKMIAEVITSRTITGFSTRSPYEVCGETADLRFLPNGTVNNVQNFIQASNTLLCGITGPAVGLIHSVAKQLPPSGSFAAFNSDSGILLNNSNEKYYGSFVLPAYNKTTTDTFYMASDTFNINLHKSIPVNTEVPAPQEGNPVFNSRGELIGIIQESRILLLHQFINQIIKSQL